MVKTPSSPPGLLSPAAEVLLAVAVLSCPEAPQPVSAAIITEAMVRAISFFLQFIIQHTLLSQRIQGTAFIW